MRRSTWIAIGIAAAVAAWLASGLFIGTDVEEDEAPSAEAPQPTLVEVRSSAAEAVPQYLYAQSVAQPYRTVDVISSTEGTLAEIEVDEGDEVEAGTVLARVRPEARESELASAEAQVESLEADLAAIRELEARGFATQSRVRELRSQLESARATLESVRSDIRDTTIEAPIPGIVSDLYVNSGQTTPVGTNIVRIVDNAPLRVTAQISQRDVGRVDVGREAVVSFATGALAKGRVCYVAPAGDPETRTFRVEIRVPNEERKVPSVVSAEIRLPTGEAQGHFVSPAILSLSEAGELGAKSVDTENVVRFHPVEMVRTGKDGIWIAGLPEEVRLITTGQGFVREGERVRVQEGEDGPERQIGRAPLPTSTVADEEFDGVEELAEAPPAEELCRGPAANAAMTSAISSGNGAASGSGAESPLGGTQPGGAVAAEQEAPNTEVEPGAATGSGSTLTNPAQEASPTAPAVPAPPNEQPAQTPGATGQQQDQGGVDGGSAEGGAP
ncbi:efflux RND transporter periplasmic adaptor subunit [Chelativorans salis]|uniref:Efflux RND transporter periplasmic adaptor subunit n=1 Tax=Chelativorans salis TaxID=2978478 RepID=A0ABT2LRQ9_9HYPH|nr:efflux RND transporter periplasmic adaptor subunit [Chelativorans sp. EGI FJ00035]MCT7377235.1 efflux RND transporter periplasmic adaptor subunit [Chelativorans sp. EGI FJ00035]